ncbi:MAG: DUF4407 domain-containing protein [Mycolicibacterium sp.]|uniref:DUF4407 domain-containing protein n=1 Tax=Mycolicibacterium sp. TaxID=2320850 RepID=UPI000FAA7A52|nr:DUF4407 domain-containing protein [Mycolicibacterium sp.]RUP27142.1 MAG: DUF4407 domain-containing protein [Mycolicibacterium sp.]
MNNRFSNLLAALAGGRADVLAVIPGARPKFVAMGSVVVGTAGMAAISAGFAVSMALGAPLPAALAIGIGWGLLILAFDRSLMVGMTNSPSVGRNLLMAVPRVVLALIMGSVISTPLTLQIFHKETAAEIATMHREAADEFRKNLAADARFTMIPDMERQVADAKALVVSHGGTDPAVKEKKAAYDAAFAKYQELQAAAQCELNGTCGTRRAGVAEAYEQAKAAADNQLVVVNAAKRELVAAADASVAQAQAGLPKAEADLTAAKNERDGLQADFDARNADNTGLLIRLEALDRLAGKRVIMGWAHALLWAMFTCIELLPVLVKLLMTIGASSEYERVQKSQDGGAADVFEAQTQAWRDAESARNQIAVDEAQKDRDIAQAEIQKDVAVAQDRAAREINQEIAINARTEQVQNRVVEAYLDVYEEHVVREAKDRLDEFQRQHPQNGSTVPLAVVQPAGRNGQQLHRNGHGTNTYVQTAQLPDGTVL